MDGSVDPCIVALDLEESMRVTSSPRLTPMTRIDPAFRGHAMAAGLTLARASLERFTSAFAQTVQRACGARTVYSGLAQRRPLVARRDRHGAGRALRHAIPVGTGLSEPTFDNTFELKSFTVVGGRHWRMQLIMEGSRTPLAAMYSQCRGRCLAAHRMRAAYRLDINVWGGQRAPC